MQYSKKVMNMKELMQECGFPKPYLMRAFRTQGQTFAFRQNPANRTSPVLFDTEEFETWRQKDIKVQQRAMRQREGVLCG